jgi:Acyl-CoA reductase (LuxC)
MNLQQRVDLLNRLGEYILSDNENWLAAKEKAYHQNNWFIPSFIDLATGNIARAFLQPQNLQQWARDYKIPAENTTPKTIGIVMAGNIPLVGFHDFLSTFLSGHRQMIKTSSKDDTLIKHLVEQLSQWNEAVPQLISFADMLKGCDAYIATGSNNSARYFEYYFSKYPHIIRRNRTSVAVLTGREARPELENLADDVHLYFGLGCRNVTKVYVPQQYDFIPLLEVFKKYSYLSDHHKYKNNYDYNLTLLLLNKQHYMTNGTILLNENKALFSPISCLNYEFYQDEPGLMATLRANTEVQCIVGNTETPFGEAQQPCLTNYADGVDTLQFLLHL